jgi:hypothetical protein
VRESICGFSSDESVFSNLAFSFFKRVNIDEYSNRPRRSPNGSLNQQN